MKSSRNNNQNTLPTAERFLYLQKLFKHHIQAFPFHNFALRETSQLHPLFRYSLTLFNRDKLGTGYNGGFCFQTAQILHEELKASGFDVYYSIAKVLNGLSPDSIQAKSIPATHLILIVCLGTQQYLLDPSMGMNGHCLPFLIPASTSTYQQNNHHFKIEKTNNQFLFYREMKGEWSTVFYSSLLPASTKTISTQLTKLGYFPGILGIRDIITLAGIATPTGGKILLWNPHQQQFMFKIISAETADKEETFTDIDRAYSLICNDFKIKHINKLQFKKYCDVNNWPKLKRSSDVNFPLDEHEICRIRSNYV